MSSPYTNVPNRKRVSVAFERGSLHPHPTQTHPNIHVSTHPTTTVAPQATASGSPSSGHSKKTSIDSRSFDLMDQLNSALNEISSIPSPTNAGHRPKSASGSASRGPLRRTSISPNPNPANSNLLETDKVPPQLLLQICELVNTDLRFDKVIRRLIEASNVLVPSERISFYLLSDTKEDPSNANESYLIHQASSSREENQRLLQLPVSRGIAGYVVKTGRSVLLAHDVASDWRYDAEADQRPNIEIQSIVTVPVRNRSGQNIGVIEAINSNNPEGYSEDDETLLKSMAINVSTVLHKAEFDEELVTRRKQTQALLQMAEATSAEFGVKRAIQKILRAAYTVVEAEKIDLFFIDERTSDLVCQETDERVPAGHGVMAQAVTTGRLVVVDDSSSDWRLDGEHDQNDLQFKTILAVPIKDFSGKICAVLRAGNKRAREKEGATFTTEDQDLLSAVAVTAGGILAMARLYDEAIHRRKQTEALLRISELMSAELGTEKVVPRIIEATYSLVPAERISLFMVNEKPAVEIADSEEKTSQKELVCVVSKDENFKGVRIPWGSGIVGHVALTGRSLNIHDAYSDPRFDSAADQKTGFVTKAILTVPVTDRDGSVLAVIQAVNRQGKADVFTSEDVTILESMAVSAGILLRKSQLLSQAVAAQRKSAALMRLVRLAANKTASVQEVIDGIVKIAYSVLEADRVSVFFVDHSRQEIFSIVSKDAQGFTLPLGKGLAGHVAKTGRLLNILDAYNDSRFDRACDQQVGYVTKSVLCVPVKDTDGTTVAVIQAINKKKPQGRLLVANEEPFTSFNNEDIEVLEAFCDEVATIIHRCLSEALLEHVSHDERDKVVSLMELYSKNLQHDRSKSISKLLASATSPTVAPPTPRSFVWPAASSVSVSDLNSLSFNVWQYNADDLMTFTVEILQDMGLIHEFQIPLPTLQNFVLSVRDGYRSNPFHNWYHGFSVFHFSYLFLRLSNASEILNPAEILALLIASLCHDIDHPGRTNAFEINTSSRLALLHNDQSVLENHHAVTCFTLLLDPSKNIFGHLPKPTQRSMRTCIIRAILATDMAVHFEKIRELDSRDAQKLFDRTKDSDRQVLVDSIVHSSDLSAQTLPTTVAKVWEERIAAEFESQAKEEETLGIPVAPFMQNLSNPLNRFKLQANFIEFVLEPWWKNIVRLFPQMRDCFINLQTNKQFFQKLASKPEPAAPAPAAESEEKSS